MYVIPELDEVHAESLLTKAPRLLAQKKKIIKIDLLYLPFYLFTITTVTSKNESVGELICIDGVKGSFSFFKEPEYANTPVKTGFIIDPVIELEKARQLGLEEYRRVLLKISLKNRIVKEVESIQFEKKVFYPYWVGYYYRGKSLDFETIDGLNGEKQGNKMRSIFIYALLKKIEHLEI